MEENRTEKNDEDTVRNQRPHPFKRNKSIMERYHRTMQKASFLTRKSTKLITLEKNLIKLNEEFRSDDLEKEFDEFHTGKNFENNQFLDDKKKAKIHQLLMKKAELDYLYIPENIRMENERKKIKICGIFSVDKSEKCVCSIF